MGFDFGLDSGQRALRASASRRRRRSSSASLNCLGTPLAMRPRAEAASLDIGNRLCNANKTAGGGVAARSATGNHIVGEVFVCRAHSVADAAQVIGCRVEALGCGFGVAFGDVGLDDLRCFNTLHDLSPVDLASPIARLIGDRLTDKRLSVNRAKKDFLSFFSNDQALRSAPTADVERRKESGI